MDIWIMLPIKQVMRWRMLSRFGVAILVDIYIKQNLGRDKSYLLPSTCAFALRPTFGDR